MEVVCGESCDAFVIKVEIEVVLGGSCDADLLKKGAFSASAQSFDDEGGGAFIGGGEGEDASWYGVCETGELLCLVL